MKDHRIFARIKTKFPVKFLNPINGWEGEAETVDIGARGVGFLTQETLSRATPLEMWLSIPDHHTPLYTRGEVVWAQASVSNGKQRVGVRLEKAELMGLARILWMKKKGEGYAL